VTVESMMRPTRRQSTPAIPFPMTVKPTMPPTTRTRTTAHAQHTQHATRCETLMSPPRACCVETCGGTYGVGRGNGQPEGGADGETKEGASQGGAHSQHQLCRLPIEDAGHHPALVVQICTTTTTTSHHHKPPSRTTTTTHRRSMQYPPPSILIFGVACLARGGGRERETRAKGHGRSWLAANVPTTSLPVMTAPAHSTTKASMMACPKVRAFEPTEGPN
jgi:hypothetical protein